MYLSDKLYKSLHNDGVILIQFTECNLVHNEYCIWINICYISGKNIQYVIYIFHRYSIVNIFLAN